MKCFYHHDLDAVGTCKSCSKALCPDCAIDLGKGIACKGHCEDDVAMLDDMIAHNAKATAGITKNIRKNTFVQAALFVGAIFLVTGFMKDLELPGILGMAFLMYGGYVLWRGISYPK